MGSGMPATGNGFTWPSGLWAGTEPSAARLRRPLPLDDFVLRIREACEPVVDAHRLEALLADWRPTLESLRRWVGFDPVRYSRRQLYRDASFELLLLCWERGQATPVHDHDGQAGWITVLEGELVLQEYERYAGPLDLRDLASAEATPPGTVPLLPARRLTLGAGSSVAEAAAPETIHRVGAPGGRALSLHLYVGPLDSFLVFDPEHGTARRVRPQASGSSSFNRTA
jgi:cysteine dioxygenase